MDKDENKTLTQTNPLENLQTLNYTIINSIPVSFR
jgi:hypothetical protein